MTKVKPQTSENTATRPSPVRIRKLGHIVLQVSDIERSRKFYTEVLNFRVSDRGSHGSVVLTAVGDHPTVALFPSDGAAAEKPAEGAVRLHHFAMQVGSL